VRVNRFEWDSINIEHIARHGVVPEEVLLKSYVWADIWFLGKAKKAVTFS
jgi:hypothetical protein